MFSRSEKLFILFAIFSAFAIACEYGITRPTSSALFLTTFSSAFFPWVWLATVPLNLAIISLYNTLLPRIGPQKLLCIVASCAIAINLSCALFLQHFPALIFFHYAWKDIYILLMFKQLWSMIHSTITASRAKYLYGFIFAMGTLGAITGSTLPGFFASRLGSEQLFFFTLPIYLFLMWSYTHAYRRSTLPAVFSEPAPQTSALSLFRSNRYLIAILCLVVLMQISVALMEYRFEVHLEQRILEKDLRTEYCGKLIGLTNALSLAFQLLGSYLLVHTLGLKRSHLFIPLLLATTSLFSWASFTLLSLSYVLLKSVDYSLFGVLREMLYIPLKSDEKYRAKAIIDVFAYRSSKALVSLAILFLQALLGSALLPFLPTASLAVFLVWIGVVLFVLRKAMPKEQIV